MENPNIFDLGLQADLAMATQSPLTRRQVLKLGAFGLVAFLASCAPGNASPTTSSTSSSDTSSDVCVSEIPSETAGPYPADGSNASNQRLNALALAGIVRQDIRTSLGTGNTAEGIPITIEMTLVNTNDNCAPLAGYAVYAWHCNRDGDYSMYSSATVDEDYLRGVQVSDSEGKLRFTSIFPGCYLGRWPHIHFEVYPSLEKATGAANIVHTSQMALVEDVCKTAYETAGYETSARNLPQITLATDNVFSDGVDQQMATMSGDVTNGYTASLTVGVAV
ncbi:MAG TPA: intradiol ring-cleavage dioxygenase [Anaerolineales bacterium]|nr:intradiol ring-cleavage dioxygenase [Anaerolineales bacterium]